MLGKLNNCFKTNRLNKSLTQLSTRNIIDNYQPPQAKNNILERLSNGVVIGDGGFVFALEKRGYVKAGPWTPEATVEFPNEVATLHREFARAGSDVMQTFTFYASEDKLENRGNYASAEHGTADINLQACKIARGVANEYDCLVAGGICQTPTYLTGLQGTGLSELKKDTKAQFKKQTDVFASENVDFMIVEYYEHVEECLWAIETVREEMPSHPVAATLCIGPEGDLHGVSCEDCALQMAEAGANIIGLNCHFDPFVMLQAIEKMRNALDKHNLLYDNNNKDINNGVHLMTQPLAYMTPDVGKQGFIDLPEFPFGLEPRVLTRWDMHKYAREAYDMGVRYIGGCCGFEPYHIRAVSEELENQRNNKVAKSSAKHEKWGKGLEMHTKPWVRARAKQEYWQNLRPASGRPHCPACSKPDNWGVTQGHEHLKQTKQREGTETQTKAN